jgi:hypothetical protein
MKTKLYPLGVAITAILFLFTSCDTEDQYKRAKALAAEEEAEKSRQQSEQEYALALRETGGDPTKASALIERQSLLRTLASVTTMRTASGQKIHYFGTEGKNLQVMLSTYCTLYPDERIVSVAGDSEGGRTSEGSTAVSYNKGYYVITEKKP